MLSPSGYDVRAAFFCISPKLVNLNEGGGVN